MDRVDRLARQWKEARPDIDVSAMHVTGRTLRFARLLDAAIERNFQGFGLAPGWFDVLAAIRRAGRPLSPTELVEACMLTSGGMTGRLDRMERAGLLRRRPDPDDRRGVRVELTGEGRRVVDEALAAHVEVLDSLLAPLSAADRASLAGLLRRLLEPLE